MNDKLKLIAACAVLLVEVNSAYAGINKKLPENLTKMDILEIADVYSELRLLLP